MKRITFLIVLLWCNYQTKAIGTFIPYHKDHSIAVFGDTENIVLTTYTSSICFKYDQLQGLVDSLKLYKKRFKSWKKLSKNVESVYKQMGHQTKALCAYYSESDGTTYYTTNSQLVWTLAIENTDCDEFHVSLGSLQTSDDTNPKKQVLSAKIYFYNSKDFDELIRKLNPKRIRKLLDNNIKQQEAWLTKQQEDYDLFKLE